jgi:hypothetical protein
MVATVLCIADLIASGVVLLVQPPGGGTGFGTFIFVFTFGALLGVTSLRLFRTVSLRPRVPLKLMRPCWGLGGPGCEHKGSKDRHASHGVWVVLLSRLRGKPSPSLRLELPRLSAQQLNPPLPPSALGPAAGGEVRARDPAGVAVRPVECAAECVHCRGAGADHDL